MTVAFRSQRPDLWERLPLGEGWPEFVLHDPVASTYLPAVEERFADWSLVLLDGDEVVAGGWAVPLAWDGSQNGLPGGWDGALERAVEGGRAGVTANTICAMAAEVVPTRRGRGLAARVLVEVRARAKAQGLASMIAPARPTLKHRYPLTTIESYATWRAANGEHFDPWIRTHARLGAEVIGVEPAAMTITGTVAEWEEWTSMAFPASGDYVVPEALATVRIDRGTDLGEYREPAMWMRHRGAAGLTGNLAS